MAELGKRAGEDVVTTLMAAAVGDAGVTLDASEVQALLAYVLKLEASNE